MEKMLAAYLAELKKIALLSPEEERSLWAAEAAGDETAHGRLMTAYQPLVFKIAASFHLREDVTMELIQEGMVGLLEAADSYDYTRGVAFSLFAMHRIRGSMCDFLGREHANEWMSLDRENEAGGTLADLLRSRCRKKSRSARPCRIASVVPWTGCPSKKRRCCRASSWITGVLPIWLTPSMSVRITSTAWKRKASSVCGACCPVL